MTASATPLTCIGLDVDAPTNVDIESKAEELEDGTPLILSFNLKFWCLNVAVGPGVESIPQSRL